jgi:hypothetical protein
MSMRELERIPYSWTCLTTTTDCDVIAVAGRNTGARSAAAPCPPGYTVRESAAVDPRCLTHAA